MKKCALQESSRVRARVHGNHGPDRKALPSFRLLGCLNQNQFHSLERLVIEQLAGHSPDYNDINNPATYEIAQACTLKTYFTPAYRQILLQTTNRPEGGVPDEWEYTDYIENADGFAEIINQFANPHFRARIAVLPPEEKLDWHIDTNTSYACRVSIMVHGQQEFLINRGGNIEQQIMKAGEIWFSNTGFSHSVAVIGDEPRVSVLVGCHHSAIEHLMPCRD